jgi:protein disulfide-isomerase
LHDTIFSKPEFQAYADSNLIFLTVDFPFKYHLPDAVNATNDFLSAKFDVEGFPTLLALNGNGKEVWRHIRTIEGGPKELISMLDEAKLKPK